MLGGSWILLCRDLLVMAGMLFYNVLDLGGSFTV